MKIKRTWIILMFVLVLSFGLASCSSVGTQTFTSTQLASYDGLNGQKAYIAVDGKVYDVSNVQAWQNGSHQGIQAGADLTQIILSSPHGKSVLKDLKIVGTFTN